jgi:glutathione reductase (NADPH)
VDDVAEILRHPMSRQFDVVVVGSGSAGSGVARACRSAGWSVAIVDSRPFGGTCALRGCDPKRVLIGAAEAADAVRRLYVQGVITGDIRIDWPKLMHFKRSFTEPIPSERERSFKEAGIATFHGRAHFVDRDRLQIGSDEIAGRFVVIAAGAQHAKLHIPGEEFLTSSTQLLETGTLPRQIVLVGGGYISFEFAHLLARAGANVQILHRGARPLQGFDAELVDRLVQATRDLGVGVHLETAVTSIERSGTQIVVHTAHRDRDRAFVADLAVHGAGRVPEIDDLGLERAGVARTKKGVAVNEYLQSTTNPAVYAAGDAADGGGLPLTPVAGLEGEIVAQNLLKGNHRSVDFAGLATIVYTIPALSSVGLSEEEAKQRNLRFKVEAADTTGWFSSRRLLASVSAFKTLIDEDTGCILGASVLGPHAEELANIFALAIRAKIPSAQLRDVLFGYPTAASDIEYMM